MSAADYESIDAVNFSWLKHFARSPAHALAAKGQPKEPTEAMDLGSAFHLLALEPEVAPSRIAVWDEGVRRGAAWTAFKEKHAGKLLLTRDAYETASAMARSVHSSPQAMPYLSAAGQNEVTLQWTEDGRSLKGRADRVSSAILDLKSTRNASIAAFGKQMFEAKVHAQLAMYRKGVQEKMGVTLPCRLIAVENFYPYTCQVFRLTEQQLEQGASEYRAWLATLAHCEKTKQWPGYWMEETDLVFPKWAVIESEAVYE